MLAHPLLNLVLAIMFMYGGVSEALDDYHARKTGLTVHHGIALYGLIMFIKSFVAVLKVLRGVKQVKERRN